MDYIGFIKGIILQVVEFIKLTDLMLNDKGTLIFEEPYLGSMYE